jgi:hypothetical protein
LWIRLDARAAPFSPSSGSRGKGGRISRRSGSQLLGPRERDVYIKKRTASCLLGKHREINQAKTMVFHERPDLDQIRLPFLPFRDRDLHENDIGLFQYLYGATQYLEFKTLRIDFHEKWTGLLMKAIQGNDL